MLEKDSKQAAQSCAAFIQEARTKVQSLQSKLQRLLDSYLDQDIEQETYRNKKTELMSSKKSLEEQIIRLEQKQTGWIEPMKSWITEAAGLCSIAENNDLLAKKVMSRKIFGSNLTLSARRLRSFAAQSPKSPLKPHWAALCAAREQISNNNQSLVLVPRAGFEPATLSLEVSCSIH